jgi:hypothetical protein
MVRSPGGSPVNAWPYRLLSIRRQPVEQVVSDTSQCQSATRDLTVGRLDDLGGFLDGPITDVSVWVGECSFSSVQASRY